MAVDLQQAAWLKSDSLGALAVPAAGVAWGSSRANAIEFTSPIDAVADANTEAARTIALLAGPNVKDRVLVAGHRRDLMFKCVTVTSDRLGYEILGPELVVNGDGSSAAGWLTPGGGNNATPSSVGGRLRLTDADAGGANPVLYQNVPTVAGRRYRFGITRFAGTAGAWIQLASSLFGAVYVSESGGDNIRTAIDFTATTAAAFVQLLGSDGVLGHYAEFDDITLKEVGRRVFVIGVTENDNNTTTLAVIRSL